MQRANRLVRTARWKNDLESALKSYKRAERDYIRAQTILDNNPL
jgi:exonuclease VII small subunit